MIIVQDISVLIHMLFEEKRKREVAENLRDDALTNQLIMSWQRGDDSWIKYGYIEFAPVRIIPDIKF